MMNAIVVKRPHYTRTRRAAAWAEERAAKILKAQRRRFKANMQRMIAEEVGILPEQAQAFNPIRGMAKVA